MSDFWWNLLPQYWHGYGRVSEWMRRCVDSVELRLKVFPHCLHENVRSLLWTDLEGEQLKKIKLQVSADIRKVLEAPWSQIPASSRAIKTLMFFNIA